MPTVIDELIVLLKLDGSSSFEKGQKQTQESLDKSKKQATATGKEMEFRARRSSESYAKFRGEVIALFAAFTAGVGLKDFIGNTIKSEANLGRMSRALDMSVENLSAWQGVLKRNGGTAEDATGAFRALADIMAEVQTTGTTAKGGILMRMGIQASDLKDPETAIIKMADVARTMDPVIASSLLRQIGFSESMTNAMLLGGQALQAQLEAQRKLGVTTKADTEAAEKLQNTLEGLKGASARVGAQILTALEPVLDLLARGLSSLAELAQRNGPIILGALTALSVALLAVGAAAATAAVMASPILLPLLIVSGLALAAGAALGALYMIVTRAARSFMEFMRSNVATRAAMAEVSQAASALWQAIVDMVAPLKPVFTWITDAFKAVSAAITDTFGGIAATSARAFIGFLVNGLHAVADGLRAVTALLRGDFKGALAAAKDFNADMSAPLDQGPARPSRVPAPAAGGASATPAASGGALSIIKGFEGFISKAKWDVNAFRAGYGSDTTTDPRTGKVSRVTSSTTVTPEMAEADLRRRVGILTKKVAASVGDSWSKLSSGAQDSLTSMAYNYGSLPRDVLKAARSGDMSALSAAVANHASDNGGVNAGRRQKEANAIGQPAFANSNIPSKIPPSNLALGSRAQAANSGGASPGVTTVQIDAINVNAPNAKDAKGVADAIGPALQRRLGYVGQVSSGIG